MAAGPPVHTVDGAMQATDRSDVMRQRTGPRITGDRVRVVRSPAAGRATLAAGLRRQS